MNNTLELPVKKKKFAIGGVFCIAFSFIILLELLSYLTIGGGLLNFISNIGYIIEGLFGSDIQMFRIAIMYLISDIGILVNLISYGISAFIFFAFGALLLLKRRSKLMFIFPIAEIATVISHIVSGIVLNIIHSIFYYDYYSYYSFFYCEGYDAGSQFVYDLLHGDFAPISWVLSRMPVYAVAAILLFFIVCILIAVVVLVNGGKKNEGKNGKMGFVSFVAAALTAISGVLCVVEAFVNTVILNILLGNTWFGHVLHTSNRIPSLTLSGSGIYNTVISILLRFYTPSYMGSTYSILGYIVFFAEIVFGILPFAVLVLAIFFSISWFVSPYKKDAESKSVEEKCEEPCEVDVTENVSDEN